MRFFSPLINFNPLLLLGLLLFALPYFIGANENVELTVESNVSESEITIGDKITYSIKVTYPLTGTLELPAVLGNLGSFEVKDFSEGEPVKVNEMREKTWTLTISTYTTGSYTIPPQMLEYTPENDTAKVTTYTEPIVIQVNRTTADNVTDIAEITDLVPLKKEPFFKVWMLLILIIIGAGFCLWYFLVKKNRGAEEAPPLPPYEAAMEALSLLARDELLANGEHKAYCFRLSEILRTFLNGRYGLDALESTTEEFLKVLLKSPLTQAHRDSITNFCHKTDPVKFANVKLTKEEGKLLFDDIKSVISQNKPREDEEQNKEGSKKENQKESKGQKKKGDKQ